MSNDNKGCWLTAKLKWITFWANQIASEWLSDQINTHNVYFSRASHLFTSPSKRHKSTLSKDKKTF